MSQLAIRGHATRGKKVIEILKMLGGKNDNHCCGGFINRIYFINEYGYIESCDSMHRLDYCQYTLEEFLEKYPYNVGNKVRFSDSNTPFTISRIWWDNNASELICTLEEQDIDVSSFDLLPYKEENMEEPKELLIGFTKDKDGNMVLNTHKDYEIKEVDGKFMLLKKKPKYPKTYEECCEILKVTHCEWSGCLGEVLVPFQKLLTCRNAYWKIAGEEMGLGKPWKPDWDGELSPEHYYVYIKKGRFQHSSYVLVFPTREMRDAFYENFKDLIEQCKELL